MALDASSELGFDPNKCQDNMMKKHLSLRP